MIRVAIDANDLAWGWSGIPKYIDRITRELVRQGEIEIVLLANTRARPFSGIEGVTEVARRVKGGGLWRELFVGPWLARARPDVFWAPSTLAPRWTAPPTVLTVHDLSPLTLPATKPFRVRHAFRSARRAIRRAEHVIAVSAATANEVSSSLGVAPARTTVVHNGVDDAFSPGDREQARATMHRRFGLEAPYVLFVGTLEARKGLSVAFDAARLAATGDDPWDLVLAGAPGYGSDEIVHAADALPTCRRLGPVSDADLADLYRAAEALIAPSLSEGFGITPLEAMASGTPAVVAGGSGGLEEISGPAAIVVGDRTPTAWLDAVAAARRGRRALAAAGVRHAARFRWSRAAAQTRAVLEEAAARR